MYQNFRNAVIQAAVPFFKGIDDVVFLNPHYVDGVFIMKIKSSGLTVLENGNQVDKNLNQLSTAQIDWAVQQIDRQKPSSKKPKPVVAKAQE